jgi:hypothetical protein
VRTREDIESGWSQGFGLDELDVATLFNHNTTNAMLKKVKQCAQKASLELGTSSSIGKEIETSIFKV